MIFVCGSRFFGWNVTCYHMGFNFLKDPSNKSLNAEWWTSCNWSRCETTKAKYHNTSSKMSNMYQYAIFALIFALVPSMPCTGKMLIHKFLPKNQVTSGNGQTKNCNTACLLSAAICIKHPLGVAIVLSFQQPFRPKLHYTLREIFSKNYCMSHSATSFHCCSPLFAINFFFNRWYFET